MNNKKAVCFYIKDNPELSLLLQKKALSLGYKNSNGTKNYIRDDSLPYLYLMEGSFCVGEYDFTTLKGDVFEFMNTQKSCKKIIVIMPLSDYAKARVIDSDFDIGNWEVLQ